MLFNAIHRAFYANPLLCRLSYQSMIVNITETRSGLTKCSYCADLQKLAPTTGWLRAQDFFLCLYEADLVGLF